MDIQKNILYRNDAFILCQKLAKMVNYKEIKEEELFYNYKEYAEKIIHSTFFVKQKFRNKKNKLHNTPGYFGILIDKENLLLRKKDWNWFRWLIKMPKPKYSNINLSKEEVKSLKEFTIFVIEVWKFSDIEGKIAREELKKTMQKAAKAQEHLPRHQRTKYNWRVNASGVYHRLSDYGIRYNKKSFDEVRELIGLKPIEDEEHLYLSPKIFQEDRNLVPRQTYNITHDVIDYELDD